MARKLLNHVPNQNSDTLLVQGEGWVDVKLSKTLCNVFQGQASFVKKDGWPDKASVGILALYVSTGFMMHDVLQAAGDPAGAAKALDGAKRVAQSTHIAEFFNFDASTIPTAPPGDARAAVPLDVAPKESIAKKQDWRHDPNDEGRA